MGIYGGAVSLSYIQQKQTFHPLFNKYKKKMNQNLLINRVSVISILSVKLTLCRIKDFYNQDRYQWGTF